MNDQLQHYQNKLEFEIDSWDLNSARTEGQSIIVIDARSKEAFDRNHIIGAVNLPHKEMNLATTGSFEKDALYVTYCDGIGCNASTKGALNMSKLGFRVKELMGGIDWWIRDDYPTNTSGNDQNTTSIQCGCA